MSNLLLLGSKEIIHEEVEHVPPQNILVALDDLEVQIQQAMKELKELLK